MALKNKVEEEKQWFKTNSYRRLITHMRAIHDIGQTKAGRRKLRLFACGVCRVMLWDQKVPKRFHAMVEAAEAFADDAISKDAMLAHHDAFNFHDNPSEWGPRFLAVLAMEKTVEAAAADAAKRVAYHADHCWQAAHKPGGKQALCRLVREIMGNPFRANPLQPGWLNWRDSTIPKIAAEIYAERRFSDLPILADALEEAGCTDAEILEHCREGKDHVRGCWVVDLMLGRDYRK